MANSDMMCIKNAFTSNLFSTDGRVGKNLILTVLGPITPIFTRYMDNYKKTVGVFYFVLLLFFWGRFFCPSLTD